MDLRANDLKIQDWKRETSLPLTGRQKGFGNFAAKTVKTLFHLTTVSLQKFWKSTIPNSLRCSQK